MADEAMELTRRFIDHRDVLFGYVLALTRDHDTAEEIFQEVGLVIVREAARGTRPADFGAWSRGLVRHRVADHFRRTRRRERAEIHLDDMGAVLDRAWEEASPDPEGDRERLAALRACLDTLSRQARRIVDARYADRLDLAAIAERLGWKPTAIKVALAKARKVLANCVQRRVAEGSRR